MTQTLEDLRQNIRMDDNVTSGILDLITDMLSEEYSRPTALMVLNRSQRYLQKRASTIISREMSVHGSPLLEDGSPASRKGTLPTISGIASGSRNSTSIQTGHPGQPMGTFGEGTPSIIASHPKIPISGHILNGGYNSPPLSPTSTFSTQIHHRDPSATAARGLCLDIHPQASDRFDMDKELQESPKDISPDDLPHYAREKNIRPSASARSDSRRVVSAPPGEVPQRKKLTNMSVTSATYWMRNQQQSMLKRLKRPPLGGRRDLMEFLSKRDIVSLDLLDIRP